MDKCCETCKLMMICCVYEAFDNLSRSEADTEQFDALRQALGDAEIQLTRALASVCLYYQPVGPCDD